ncbi:MAG: DUF87 domain-containing protein [Caldilineaceae bacterium]|nr:DUF87 domain-containing protein [Caldilineaceae bacterium]
MTILNIDANGSLQIPLQSTIGEKVAVLGIAGSGKTNTAAVIIEELLSNNLPMTIVDIEGEYWGLKERFDIIVIGRSENVDIEVDASHAAHFATYSVEQGVPLILDLSDYDMEEMHEFMLAYFAALWEATFKARRPYEVVLEEAHEWIPQGARAPLKEILVRFALRGRKRGIGMIIISQRSAKVEKSVLTQSSVYLLHQVVHPIDMKVYQEILPLPGRMVEERVGNLHKGDALVMVSNTVHNARIRLRHTYHAGATPELDAGQRVQLRRADDGMLAELRKLVTAKPEEAVEADGKTEAEVMRLRGELTRREGVVTAHKAEIARLAAEVERLKTEVARWKQAAATKPAPMVPTNNSHPQPAKRPALLPSSLPEPSRGVAQRSEHAQVREQRRWEALLRDLRQLQRYKRDILIFLLEREDATFTVKQLAKALVLSESTISRNPPLDVIEMGLIKRSGTPGQFRYLSNAREKLREMFPGLDTDELIDKMIRRLK